jgi:hypothetical protein
MGLRERFTNRQPQAQAAKTFFQRTFALFKRIENSFDYIGRNSNTLVLHTNR